MIRVAPNSHVLSPKRALSTNRVDSRTTDQAEWCFVGALICINLFQLCSAMESVWDIPHFIKYGFSGLGVCLLAFFRIHSQRVHQGSLGLLALWLTAYTAFLLITSFRPETVYLQEIFADRYYFLPYLIVALLVSARIDARLLAKTLAISKRLLIPAILTASFVLVYFSGPSDWERCAAMISAFDLFGLLLLLTAHLYKKWGLTAGVFLFYIIRLVLVGIYGRRGGFILYGVALVLALWQQLKSRAVPGVAKAMVVFVVALLLCISALYSQRISDMYVFERGLSEDGFNKSRSKVFQDYFDDFSTQRDFLFGRGLNGTVNRTIQGDTEGRGIENGYLTILLKGGLLYLVPMLLLMLRSVYLGLFRARNDLSKALAAIIIWEIINMMAFGLPNYSTSYILLWVAIAAGFNVQLRNLQNRDVHIILKQPLSIKNMGRP